jgi:diguanylate cyclase (GGDEF)-like protein
MLTVVAITCGAVIVGMALVGLRSPAADIHELDGRVLPGAAAVDDARHEAVTAQTLFLTALSSLPEQRGGLIADAQDASNRGNTAWREYQRRAYGSKPELRLQRQYARVVREGQSAGAALFAIIDSPGSPEYETALTREQRFGEQQIAVLDNIESRFYAPRVLAKLTDARESLEGTRKWILISFGAVLLLGLVIAIVHMRGALREERVAVIRDRERVEGQRRADLENQLQRGLEMVPSEEDTYGVIAAALHFVRPGRATEVLLADSSRAHFRRVLTTDSTDEGSGCPVPSPRDCPAATSGQTRLFLSGTRLDACPFLRNRADPARSATCIPISIAGTTTGVIHATGLDGQQPSASEMADLELVARKAGDRIGFLRVLSGTKTEARVDSLTGLLNRRSIDLEGPEILQHDRELVVAYADLDSFKALNDVHGHEAGDRALRLFGRVLRDSIRPSDVAGRYGGEEFVVLLPDCNLADAAIVMHRIREHLASAIDAATVPELTVSIGLAAWTPPEMFNDTVARADAALLEAKAAGRDRVVISKEPARVGGIAQDAPVEGYSTGVFSN